MSNLRIFNKSHWQVSKHQNHISFHVNVFLDTMIILKPSGTASMMGDFVVKLHSFAYALAGHNKKLCVYHVLMCSMILLLI